MTDSETNNNTGASVNDKFTAREIELLGFAMQSLKSGPPEIDYDNLAKLAGMTNPKSAANAWGKIKVKLMTPEGADKPVATPKPKKGRGPAKAKATKADKADEGDAENGNENGDAEVKATPKKTPRKRAPKTNDNEGSPKKRGRKTKKELEAEKAAVKEEIKDEPKEEEVKEEPKESQEAADSDGSAISDDAEVKDETV